MLIELEQGALNQQLGALNSGFGDALGASAYCDSSARNHAAKVMFSNQQGDTNHVTLDT